MKKLLFVIVVLFSSIFAIGQDQDQIEIKEALNQINGWQKYKSEDLAILAYFPGKPNRSIQKVETAVGELDMHMIMYTPTSGDDNLIYAVIRSDYPKSQFESANNEYNQNVLNGAVEGAVNNVNGKLLSEERITFNGYPGRQIKVSAQGAFLYLNAYLVENSMFITQVITLESNDGNSDIDKFRKSFDILRIK